MPRTAPAAATGAGVPGPPAAALDAAVRHLCGLQHPSGWWRGELATNVTMEAEDLLLREFLGVRTAALTEETARWIRSQQRCDGTWARFHGGPGDLSTTVEAWVARGRAGVSDRRRRRDRPAVARGHHPCRPHRRRLGSAAPGGRGVDCLADLGPVTTRETRLTDEDVTFALPREVT
ncbi:hypothetical protein HF526_24695 [Pseudonocardia sp. K10HN5]|uniref:Squalene cyclase N-terminal domain-containing protein n=1 Tax=Pseudonocardia acidicola TaxID=2724939 RepID=A0ABX1SHT2_9PSEU|nr:hypothetical protein [Pseudonocardia acidicola]